MNTLENINCLPISTIEELKHYDLSDNLTSLKAFITLFHKFPNKFILSGTSKDFLNDNKNYSIYYNYKKFCKDLKSLYPDTVFNKVVETNFFSKNSNQDNVELTIIIPSKEVTMTIRDGFSGHIIYYSDYEVGEHFLKMLNSKKYIIRIEKEKPTKTISLIQQTQAGYDLFTHEIKQYDVNIKKHYNDDFVNADKKILKFINEENASGLVILNGIKGTGKTTYIRHLINTTERRFVYLTKDMARALVDPSFISFLTKISNCVLVIEDCENLVAARSTGNHDTGISNLLNMCDGLLSDLFNIKIIATFNEDISKIDSALLRKGRLICRYEFDKLSIEKTNKLLKSLKIKYTSDEPMALCDIFNFNYDNGGVEAKKAKIGFGK